jgi:hypothetical protein
MPDKADEGIHETELGEEMEKAQKRHQRRSGTLQGPIPDAVGKTRCPIRGAA